MLDLNLLKKALKSAGISWAFIEIRIVSLIWLDEKPIACNVADNFLEDALQALPVLT